MPGTVGDDMAVLDRFLERLFAASLWLAALHLIAIAVLVGAQVLGRVTDKTLLLIGLEPINFVILSLAEIAGYLLAGASFLALAGTFKAGSHIRVTMLLQTLRGPLRHALELAALTVAFAFACFMSFYTLRLVLKSWQHGDVSVGVYAIPLWLPQATMAAGAVILALAVAHEFAFTLKHGKTSFSGRESEVSLASE